MTRLFLFLLIIPITILIVTFSLIIILVYYSNVYYSIVYYSSIIVLIHVKSVFFITVEIKDKTEIYYRFIMLPIIDTNNRIFRCVRDWKRRKTFNKFSKLAMVKIASSQASK